MVKTRRSSHPRHGQIHTQSHTCTYTHTDPCTQPHTYTSCYSGDMARQRGLRPGRSYCWGDSATLREVTIHDRREHTTQNPPPTQADKKLQAPHQGTEQSSHPGRSRPRESTPNSQSAPTPQPTLRKHRR